MNIPHILIVAILTPGLAAPAIAANQTDKPNQGATRAQTSASQPLTEGVVKKIDKRNGKLTISHGPLSNGMAGMTMAFRLKNAEWLDDVQVGQKIRFAVDENMIVIRLETSR